MTEPFPMRFFCVRTEAIAQTHRALQGLHQQSRRGSGRPSRALRVAQLYGHLQCRANATHTVRLSLKHLAESWQLQPRELRADLNDLQAIGWLRYRTDIHGTTVQLTPAEASNLPSAMQHRQDSPDRDPIEGLRSEATGVSISEPAAL